MGCMVQVRMAIAYDLQKVSNELRQECGHSFESKGLVIVSIQGCDTELIKTQEPGWSRRRNTGERAGGGFGVILSRFQGFCQIWTQG